jgi:hypothetical protein
MIPAVLALQVVERQETMTLEAAIASPRETSLLTSSAAKSSRFSAATHERIRSRQ